VPDQYSYDDISWAYILERCERDFLYLASNYLRFKSKHVIGFPTLKLNGVQTYLYGRMMDQWKRTGKIRQVWGKARQTGASTLARAFSFHRAAFRNHINALLVAHDEPDAMELFQLDKGFYDALPPRLKPVRKYDTKSKIEFENRNSKILVNHARNMNVGASQMNHIVHLTEVARYPNGSEVQGSLFPSISEAKGDDCSVVIIESTSHFGGEWFKLFAEESMRGRNEYEFCFVPWYMHSDYRLPVPKGFAPTGEERDLLRRFPDLNWENLVWYRLKRAEYTANLPLFCAEYPFSWEESWILPAGTSRTFQEEVISYIEQLLRPGERYWVESDGLRENIAGPVEVWEPPQKGVFYDIGIDISEGRTETADYTAIEVVRRDTLAQVAEVRGHFDPAGAEFLDLVYWLGRAYNSGQMIPDITGGWGHALMTDLQHRNYPNIWQWRRRDDANEKVSSRLGFYYTRRDKTWLVHNAVKTLQRECPSVQSPMLLSELRNFLTIGLDEWGASPGTYDDLCNAYMLALLGATDERPRSIEPLPPDERRREARPWLVHDIEGELDGDRKSMVGTYIDRVLSSQ
jgi:hypothetical protein